MLVHTLVYMDICKFLTQKKVVKLCTVLLVVITRLMVLDICGNFNDSLREYLYQEDVSKLCTKCA